MPRLITDIAGAHGLTADAEYAAEYPVTVNDAAEAAFAGQVITEVFGPDRGETAKLPITGAEDFSFVLEEVPGAFVFLGACPPDRDPETAPTNHSAIALFDDSVLAEGTALYAELALRRLSTGPSRQELTRRSPGDGPPARGRAQSECERGSWLGGFGGGRVRP